MGLPYSMFRGESQGMISRLGACSPLSAGFTKSLRCQGICTRGVCLLHKELSLGGKRIKHRLSSNKPQEMGDKVH